MDEHVLLLRPSCVSVLLRASSIPDICLSSTWTTPFTSSLAHSFLLHNPPHLSIVRLTLQSHMKACLTYACQRNILQHEDEKSRGWGFQIRPMNTYKHTLLHIHIHINTPTSSHCMGQRGSLKVRDWSLLFSSGCLSVTVSFLWGPASTHNYHV